MTGLQHATMIESASTLRKEGRFADAINLLGSVLQANPQNGRACHQLGLALVESGAAEGLQYLEMSVSLDSTDVDRYADLADARFAIEAPAAGIATLRSAVALAPARDDIVLRLGKMLGRAGAVLHGDLWMQRALRLRRPFSEAHVARGAMLSRAGRQTEAIEAFSQAVLDDPSDTNGFIGLAAALQAAGVPRAQVMKASRIAAERLPDRPDLVIPVAQYHRDIGDEAECARLVTRLIGGQMERGAQDQIGALGLRLLIPSDMIERIGELAFQLDLHVKMKALGWLPPFVSVLLAPKNVVANQVFLDCWRPHLTIVDDPALIETLDRARERIAFNPVYVRLPDGRTMSKNRAFFAVQQEWQRQGRGPLLELSRKQMEWGKEKLKRMGVPDGAWFVCVHVREAGYLKEKKGSTEATRNADIADYLPGIGEITKRGGWVIRLGDASMKPLAAMPRVFDYACSPHKSEEMDIFLAANCRFFFGTTSGMCIVSSTFGVPVGGANFFPIGERLVTSKDVVVPKLYRERSTGRILPFKECLTMPLALTYDAEHFASLGLEAMDTDAESLRDLAVEMLERADGLNPYDTEDEALQRCWNDLGRSFSTGDVGCRIGRGFLRRHRHLLAGGE